MLDAGWFYDPDYEWGAASSPIIYKDLVIVQVDRQKDSFIAAYRLKDGEPVWRTARDEIPSWGTPTVYQGPPRDELVTHATKFIRAYDPLTGKELWRLGPNSEITTPTPIVAHGLIYVTNGYRGVQPIYAIKPGGSGDLTLPGRGRPPSPFIAWSTKRGGPYTPTPVVYGDHLYTDRQQRHPGRLRREDRRAVYQERVAGKGGAFSASPVAADGKLYLSGEDGEVFVVKPGRKPELLATNPMGEVLMATPGHLRRRALRPRPQAPLRDRQPLTGSATAVGVRSGNLSHRRRRGSWGFAPPPLDCISSSAGIPASAGPLRSPSGGFRESS